MLSILWVDDVASQAVIHGFVHGAAYEELLLQSLMPGSGVIESCRDSSLSCLFRGVLVIDHRRAIS